MGIIQPQPAPQSPAQAAERHLLGMLLRNPRTLDDLGDEIQTEDFAGARHRKIHTALRDLDTGGAPVDVLTVAALLEQRRELARCGGRAYLDEMLDGVPPDGHAAHYARIVRGAAIERRLLQAAESIVQTVRGPGEPAEKLDRAGAMIGAITEPRTKTGPILARDLIPQVVEQLQTLVDAGGEYVGQPSGWPDLDHMTGGFRPGQLVVVAGRPSMGKTSLALNIAEHVSVHGSKTALVFSLEMSANELLMRSVASLGNIDLQHVLSARMDPGEWSRFTDATARIQHARLLVDETPWVGIHDLRTRARRVLREHGLDLVVVDYLQLMEGPGEHRTAQITAISRGLKLLAKELNVPVIALSQLNRSLEHRPNKRPMMSDLRESGAIEQDADLIVFLYRDEVYDPDSLAAGSAEAIIGKQRNGPIGTVHLAFRKETCRFSSFAGSPPPRASTQKKPGAQKWKKGFEY